MIYNENVVKQNYFTQFGLEKPIHPAYGEVSQTKLKNNVAHAVE